MNRQSRLLTLREGTFRSRAGRPGVPITYATYVNKGKRYPYAGEKRDPRRRLRVNDLGMDAG